MNPQRAYVRTDASDNLELEVPKVLINSLANKVTNTELWATFQVFFHVMMSQANRENIATVNPNVATSVTKIRDFAKMNLLEFNGYKIDEDHQVFIGEVYTI